MSQETEVAAPASAAEDSLANTALGRDDVKGSAVRARSPARRARARFLRHRMAVAGLVFVALIVLAAFLAPVIAQHDPNVVDISGIRSPPSMSHWLGTDNVGRDVFSRLLHGGRVSLMVGVAAALSTSAIGLMLGLVAGVVGGWVDSVIMRSVDVVLAFPGLLVFLLLVGILGPGVGTLVGIFAAFGWPAPCRIVRQVTLSLREQDFVFAARALGANRMRIARSHVLPSVLSPLTVVVALQSAGFILAESALSFLGLGIRQPQASWGGMINAAQSVTVLEQLPWLWLPPGLAIAGTVLAINFIGDGLRDALDPRQRL